MPSLSTNERNQAVGMLRAGQSSQQVAAVLLKALYPGCCNALTQHNQQMIGDVLVVLGQQQGNKTITSVTLLIEICESLRELCNIS